MVLALFETSAGFCLVKVTDAGLLQKPASEQRSSLDDPTKASNLLKLQAIHQFQSTAEGVEEITALSEGKISKTLKKFLVEEVQGGKKKGKDEQLIVSDPKLGGAIAKKLSMAVISDSTTQDLFRGIRQQLATLLAETGVDDKDLSTMSLGLSHSLSRYKLKFSPDKVDTMIVQAIALLDDLDKEINIYAMRVKEWYGWHFPEMAKIISDNQAYAKVVKAMGFRTNAATTDFSEILPEDLEEVLKAAAVISMGTEISTTDLQHIHLLADQVISISQYRTDLYTYLTNRMNAIAPNLTALVGELVGARLIAHAGSLMTLAKHPASTIQILGAEKALFRALKTKHDTPKYGLIYHSSLIGQATGRNKGKIARMLSAKAALGLRVDAFDEELDEKDDEEKAILGLTSRIKLENHLRKLEGKAPLPKGTNVAPTGEIITAGQFTLKETRRYNADADGVADDEEVNGETTKKSKKSKVQEKEDVEMEDAEDSDEEATKTPAKGKKLSEADYERLAEAAGLSVKKFKRKYERGDVELNEDGTPKVFSKKELKKLRKAEESTPSKTQPTPDGKKKRKHDEEAEEADAKKEKKQKKKKRHSTEA